MRVMVVFNTKSSQHAPSSHTCFFLIRHGATVLSAEDRFAGATDVKLSDEGRRAGRADCRSV